MNHSMASAARPTHADARQIRAPREHGAIAAFPPLSQADDLLDANCTRRLGYSTPVGSMTLSKLAEMARSDLLEAARSYTEAYQEPPAYSASQPIIATGHQPELFHPGVWVKDFVVDRLARRHDAVPIHVIVDNDVAADPTVRVPQTNGVVVSIPLQPGRSAMVPHEERIIENVDAFLAAGAKVQSAVAPLVDDPIVDSLWKAAAVGIERRQDLGQPLWLGQVLAESRHQLEYQWGVRSLEVPLSELCKRQAFRLFAGHLLAGADSLHAMYNDEIREYRRVRRLRSKSHPAPILTRDGDFFEAPFWIWTSRAPTRKPLFVARHGSRLILRAGADADSPQLETNDDIESVADALEQWESQDEWKLRPRALITTLYIRLLLSDLFLHGIGGGKYDAVTDQLALDFFGHRLPGYLTVTATMVLPAANLPIELDDLRQVDGMLRELWYHPEASFEMVPMEHEEEFRRLAQQKQDLLAHRPPKPEARLWHQRLDSVNEALRELFHEPIEALEVVRSRLARQQSLGRVLGSREYAFCLFSPRALRATLCDGLPL